jgi:hypothetical protein
MANFTAFSFCDNDFHQPLRDAIIYVVDNRTEELTLNNFREAVLRGMVAFNQLRRIDNWTLEQPCYNRNYRTYFENTLTVIEIAHLKDLSNFEGYVLDNNLMTVYYLGYGNENH